MTQPQIFRSIIDTVVDEETAVTNAKLTLCVEKKLIEIGEPPEKWSFLSLYERKGEGERVKKILDQRVKIITPSSEILKIINEETELANVELKERVDKRCVEIGIDPLVLNFQVEHIGVTAVSRE